MSEETQNKVVVEFVDSKEYEQMSDALNAEAEAARKTVRLTRGVSRKKVAEAFQQSFDLIGGVPRLSYWAHENYGEFIKLYSKLMPAQSSRLMEDQEERVIKHVIPPTELDQ